MSYIEKELSWINEKNGNELSAEKFLTDTFSSDNNCLLASEYAIFASPLTFSIAFGEMKEYLNIDTESEKIRYEDLYVKFTQQNSTMLSLQEIDDLVQKFIDDFINENGGHYLRIWDATSNQGWFNDESLNRKYNKVVPILQKWFNNWLEENLNVKYKVEAYLIGDRIQSKIKEYCFSMKYTQEDCEELWGILRAIHHSFYNKELINSLQDTIQDLIIFCCPKDYQDIKLNKENLHQLYVELNEALHKKEGFQGHELFHDYDGYGNVIWNLDGTICTDMYYEIELKDGE